MRLLFAVVLWAVAFAFVESAVVDYLRALYYPLAHGGFKFPIQTVEQIKALGEEHWRRLLIELGREASTLLMLATVGIVAGKNRRESWAYFMIAFGVWDIFYYLWLKLFLDWPPSIMTWDLLFLVPVPWVAPVLAPVLVSLALITSGITVLRYEGAGRPVVTCAKDWALVTGGGLTVIVSFCWDYINIMNGGYPNPFHWPLFFVGFALAAGAFVAILIRQPVTPV
ncbi:MAG: hypothetical protein WBG50_12820 [Desulfomonilaceae bacterium]